MNLAHNCLTIWDKAKVGVICIDFTIYKLVLILNFSLPLKCSARLCGLKIVRRLYVRVHKHASSAKRVDLTFADYAISITKLLMIIKLDRPLI